MNRNLDAGFVLVMWDGSKGHLVSGARGGGTGKRNFPTAGKQSWVARYCKLIPHDTSLRLELFKDMAQSSSFSRVALGKVESQGSSPSASTYSCVDLGQINPLLGLSFFLNKVQLYNTPLPPVL